MSELFDGLFLLCLTGKTKTHTHIYIYIYRVSEFRQIEIHTAEPLVPDPSPSDAEIFIEKLKSYE
jgi:hypothetical protein